MQCITTGLTTKRRSRRRKTADPTSVQINQTQTMRSQPGGWRARGVCGSGAKSRATALTGSCSAELESAVSQIHNPQTVGHSETGDPPGQDCGLTLVVAALPIQSCSRRRKTADSAPARINPPTHVGGYPIGVALPVGRRQLARWRPRARPFWPWSCGAGAIHCTGSQTVQLSGSETSVTCPQPQRLVTVVLLGLLLSVLCLSSSAQLAVPWWTVDGGGGTSTGGVFRVTGTIGQPDAGGPMTGGQYTVTGGFWALPVVVQMPGAPRLYITNAAPGYATIWWEPAVPGWTLQESLSVAPSTWTNSPSGTNNPVTVPITHPTKFYRLFKP